MEFKIYFSDGSPCRRRDTSSERFRSRWQEKETEVLTRYYSGIFKVKPKRKNSAD